MGKGARIRKLKDEEAKLLMASKKIAPALAPRHREMILAIIRAFEMQHRCIVPDAPLLAQYISEAHYGAMTKGFFMYHNDLMKAIAYFFDNKFEYPGVDKDKLKNVLIDFLNLPSDDSGKNKPESEGSSDGDRATGPKIHPLEQKQDKSSRNASDEKRSGGARVRDQHLKSPRVGPQDPEASET